VSNGEGWLVFGVGFGLGFALAAFFAVFNINARANDVCQAAAAEFERDCYLDEGACWCADGDSIRELGAGE